jgi:leucyl-tRNA synthetase
MMGNASGESLRVFTTRPDTLFGATYMVVAPEHPLVELALAIPFKGTDVKALSEYVQWARNRADVERQESKEKTGVFTGPPHQPGHRKPIPVWTADYVLMGYGTGAIMAVPAQDPRDFEFARRFSLPIIRTVQPPTGFPEDAGLHRRRPGDQLGVPQRTVHCRGQEEDHPMARRAPGGCPPGELPTARLALLSRQRYWGEPFPIVFDERGQHHPVSEDALPVQLPALADYQPIESDEPLPLLARRPTGSAPPRARPA